MPTKFSSIPENAERFDALYQWLHRLYGLEPLALNIGNFRIRMFKVKKMDELLEHIASRPNPTEDDLPYWAELWPSALALATFLVQEVNCEGNSVLELGCGLGLVGIVAGLKGAQVWLTDFQPDALRLAELNWMMNLTLRGHFRLLDWRHPDWHQKFPIILVSDVAYEARLFDPLIACFQHFLSEDGTIYLSEPNRQVAQPFFRKLRQSGFFWKKNRQKILWLQREHQISIYQIQRARPDASI